MRTRSRRSTATRTPIRWRKARGVGTVVGVTAASSDINGPTVFYTLTADSSGGGFAIDLNGVVTVADPSKINYEQGTHQYTITVQASDGQGGVSSSNFVIDVTNVIPIAPFDSDAGANTVTEGATAGTTVGVIATSTDINGPTVTYAITADTSGGGFAIDLNGVVTVADPSKINYEQGTHQYNDYGAGFRRPGWRCVGQLRHRRHQYEPVGAG